MLSHTLRKTYYHHWPWISRREHEKILAADREWRSLSARTHFTFATRESAREGYKVGLEEGLRRSASNE